MALTEDQKRELDNIMIGLLDDFVQKKEVTYRDIQKRITLDGVEEIHPVSITASLNRIFGIADIKNKYHCMYNDFKGTFIFASVMLSLNVRKLEFSKEKNILHFKCYEGLTYDFITKTFNYNLDDFLNKKILFTPRFLGMLEYEWLFNYVNNIRQIEDFACLNKTFYQTMPQGLYKVIQENNNTLTPNLLVDYYDTLKYGKYKNFARSFPPRIIDKFIEFCPFDKLIKMIKNDITNGIFLSLNEIECYLSAIIKIKECFDFSFDYNRGLQYNYKRIRESQEKERIAILNKKMQRLNFINGLYFGDYVVIVPQSQEEKLAEGRMQNNCVGHYYDDSIIDGKNLIYFIRKISDVNHSYITCRYSTQVNNTVEFKLKNNKPVYDTNDIEVIKQISDIIREHFKQELNQFLSSF